jgi:DNA-binding PadR family transcriptional regulator
MFGRHHHRCEGGWDAAGRRGRHGGGFGFGGFGHGDRGAGDTFRVGRMLAQGDLRLLALALIGQQPRHGYEIIKLVEEKTGGWYSPSPGVVYPTLTYLEEAGQVTVVAEGSKKLYTITDEGRAYLEENRELADTILERLEALGEKAAKMRRAFGWGRREDAADQSPLVSAALQAVREAAAATLEKDREAEARIAEILARAASDIRRGQ